MYYIRTNGDYYIRSVKKIQNFYWLSPIAFGRTKSHKRKATGDKKRNLYLADKRTIPEILPEDRTQTWSKIKEEKSLTLVRISYIISLEHIRGGDLYGKRFNY